MQPKTKLILYSVIGILLLSMIIISFFINQSVQHPKINKGVYKEPATQLKSQPIKQNVTIEDKYQCGNVTAEAQGTCVALGWMLNNMELFVFSSIGLVIIFAFIKSSIMFEF